MKVVLMLAVDDSGVVGVKLPGRIQSNYGDVLPSL
jgi:hypothetical protein